MPKVYSYIRFSRPEQLRGDSLRRQRDKADEWAAERGLVIDESIQDLGVSAFRGFNRVKGALGAFLRLVEQGRIERGSYLVIESLDRFGRDRIRQVMPAFLEVINAGIIIVTLADGQELSAERVDREPMAIFGAIMVMMRANDESRMKSERLKEAWGAKRASGAVITSRVPGWLKVEVVDGKRRIVEIPERVEIVRQIFVETIAGYGRRQVALRLNRDGKPAFVSKSGWHPSYVQKLLEGRAVLGEYQAFKRGEDGVRRPVGMPVADYFPAIVSEDDFVTANDKKAGRTTLRGLPGKGVTNLLRGLARCGCGASMSRENKGMRGGGAYLVCSNANRGAGCENLRRWKVVDAERIVLRAVSALDVGTLLRKENVVVPAARTEADIVRLVEDTKARRERIYDAVERGDDGASDRAMALSVRLKALEAELAEHRLVSARRAAEPSPDQRRRRIAELFARLENDGEEELADLRTRIGQELRSTLTRVTFARHQVTLVYPMTAARGRAALTPGRKEIVVKAFDDDPVHVAEMMAEEEDERSSQ
ncbi:recombinase family protein [Methylobacterium sp. J-076]|uniref:recombinase family protein n=1 Tax=Methylobacterium sp. J-076 TaxID=2836655 RepID=UPI001FB9C854|nr:recombinase family protein [Methylobacterium sp. J-076]MCJ2014204.1 recombinase family protein [Methylobacterium sp. J-076]